MHVVPKNKNDEKPRLEGDRQFPRRCPRDDRRAARVTSGIWNRKSIRVQRKRNWGIDVRLKYECVPITNRRTCSHQEFPRPWRHVLTQVPRRTRRKYQYVRLQQNFCNFVLYDRNYYTFAYIYIYRARFRLLTTKLLSFLACLLYIKYISPNCSIVFI